ncbi:hypothetical protein F4803DRAFT_350104 [Xylaria telfairii]|nr:hypothetical protein F4803DRAFT_350104 [Xylaria telfairii]
MANDVLSSDYVGWRLYVFIGVFTPLQVGLVVLRFYVRQFTSRTYGWDDWLVSAAILGQLAMAGIAIGSVEQGGVGYHIGYLAETNPEAIPNFFKYLLAISAWYLVIVNLPKLAILVVYRRLFPQKPLLYLLYGLGFILIAAPFGSLIAVLAACHPFSANWGSAEVQATHCINKEALFVWNSFPNIVTDFVMLIIPLPIVWRLHATLQLKLGLTVTFLIGGSGLVASVLRFVAFSRTNSFTDATYNAVELIIWTLVEPGISIICVCVMMFRPLFERLGFSGVRTKYATNKYATAQSRRSEFTQDSGLGDGTNLALGNIAVKHHFERLSTPEDIEERGLVQHGHPVTSNQILVTTKIEVSGKS